MDGEFLSADRHAKQQWSHEPNAGGAHLAEPYGTAGVPQARDAVARSLGSYYPQIKSVVPESTR